MHDEFNSLRMSRAEKLYNTTKMNRIILIICNFLFLFAEATFAQVDSLAQPKILGPDSTVTIKPRREIKPQRFKMLRTDSVLIAYSQKLKNLSLKFANYRYTKSDTLSNPYYFYIFAQPTYYSATMHQMIGCLSKPEPAEPQAALPPLLPEGGITPRPLIDGVSRALTYVYTQSPELITRNEDAHLSEFGLRNDVNQNIKPTVKLTEKVSDQHEGLVDNFTADNLDIIVHKPNFWTFRANIGFKIMQYFVSDNWYKGGESNYSWLATSTIEANYNNKQKVTFDNKLEMRLGFQSSKDDSKHKFRSNSDQLRLTNKLGLRATKHWYYTFTLQSWTQFYPAFRKNDSKVYSDFMSPFEMVPSLGMDYKLNVKNFNMNASISPFAGNFKYVDRKDLAPAFGIDQGKHSKFDFGSNITIKYNWNIMKNVSWNGRIFYFTDYETTRVEWENTFNLKINEFLSTQLFVYPRFDDGVNRKDGQSYFQFNEWMSLGFNYNF